MTGKELTIGDLMDELQEYPRDTPLWPQLELANGVKMMLDLEYSSYSSLDGVSHELHLIFKKSKIYDLKKEDLK